MKNFARIQPADRNELARIVRRLRLRREDADYRPGAFIDEGIRRNALRDMKTAGLLLGEEL